MKKLLMLSVIVISMQANAQFWQGFVQGMNQAVLQIQRQQQIERQRQRQAEIQRKQQEERERQAEAARIKKTYKSEDDGYSWYKTEQYGKYGAETADGKTIVPISFSSLFYHNGCFYVNNGNYEGLYEKDGTYAIPTSKGYTSVLKISEDDSYYYKVEKNNKQGACDTNGREIITPQYESVIYSSGQFKYKNSAGEYVNTGISLNGSSCAFSADGSKIDFIFDLYTKKSVNEEINPIPKMPQNGKGTFNEYIVRVELKANSIDYNILIVDRMNDDKIDILESHSIVPSSSVLAISADGKIQFCEYENGRPRGIVINDNGAVAIGRWNDNVFVEGWHFLPFSLYSGIEGSIGNIIAMYKGLIGGFNKNTNFEHTQAGENDFDGKYIKLKTALQRYNWKRII